MVKEVQLRKVPETFNMDHYEAFTSGNLHRIRKRRLRDQIICGHLDKLNHASPTIG